ncbi:SEC-C domain-containing protein, partial [bacterium]|nr:SEC-C domain-containing protein [bacterium]
MKKTLSLIVVLLPALLAAALYFRSYTGQFVWDDTEHQLRQTDRFQSMEDFFFNSFFAGGGLEIEKSPYYRPLIVLTYKIDEFWNGVIHGDLANPLDPRYAVIPHITTILIHVLTSIMVALLALQILTPLPSGQWAAVISGALFASHPVHVESVSFIAGRTDSLAMLFMTTAVLMALLYRERLRSIHLFGTALSTLLALLSKEVALSLFLLIPAFLWLVPNAPITGPSTTTRNARPNEPCPCGSGRKYKKCHGQTRSTTHKPERLRRKPKMNVAAKRSMVMAQTIILIVYVSLRSLADLSGLGEHSNGLFSDIRGLLSAVAFYAKNLIWPWPQLHFVLDLPGTAFTTASMVLGTGVVALSLYLYKKGWPYLLVSALWFVLTIVPSLSAVTSGLTVNPVSERFLYVPSFGICLAAGAAFAALHVRPALQHAAVVLSFIIVVIYSAATILETGKWRTESSLWAAAARHPHGKKHGRIWSNLGRSFLKIEEPVLARSAFEQAVRPGTIYNDDGRAGTYTRLCSLDIRAGWAVPEADTEDRLTLFARAEQYCRKALLFSPEFFHALNNFGLTILLQDEITEERTGQFNVPALQEAREKL